MQIGCMIIGFSVVIVVSMRMTVEICGGAPSALCATD